ncbi:MAG TPA: acyltransferase [Candidatus Limnocylindria bacterium]|jgi:acetyltransferase-like isoleucine patch superfamily enzyme|nr:acyltransferase [Candidatus Limnocylindrales bacterium]HWH24251.1 acyltransferase [Candidatus Limnocylindria bacterium]
MQTAGTGRYLEHDWFPRLLPPNVLLGPRSWLYSSYALLHFRSRRPVGLRIGADTGVYIGSQLEVGPSGEVSIGAFGAIAGPIIATNSRITIGDYALISYGVVIAEEPAMIPPGPPSATPNGRGRAARPIDIGDNVWIGARAIVLGGARIGEGAIIGAGAVVDFEVEPFAIVAGNPARVVGHASAGGARR